MKELDEIKNRIHKRRGSSREVDVDVLEVETKYTKASKLYKFSMFILVILTLFFSIALYAKKDENGKFLKESLGINVNFTSFNETMNKLINFRAFNSGIGNDQVVSNIPSYIHTGDNLYICDGNDVKSIDDGVVTYIVQDENGYLVIVENDSGFRSVYSNLTDISVKVNDRIYFDSVIGVYEDKVKIVFSKNSKEITYEQVLELL